MSATSTEAGVSDQESYIIIQMINPSDIISNGRSGGFLQANRPGVRYKRPYRIDFMQSRHEGTTAVQNAMPYRSVAAGSTDAYQLCTSHISQDLMRRMLGSTTKYSPSIYRRRPSTNVYPRGSQARYMLQARCIWISADRTGSTGMPTKHPITLYSLCDPSGRPSFLSYYEDGRGATEAAGLGLPPAASTSYRGRRWTISGKTDEGIVKEMTCLLLHGPAATQSELDFIAPMIASETPIQSYTSGGFPFQFLRSEARSGATAIEPDDTDCTGAEEDIGLEHFETDPDGRLLLF